MSRTLVIPTTLTRDNYLPDPAGVALNPGAGNGHRINSGAAAGLHLVDGERCVLRVSTGTSGGTVTIKAATNVGSRNRDLVVPVAATSTVWIGPFESAQYDSQGQILVDVDSVSSDGRLTAFSMTR